MPPGWKDRLGKGDVFRHRLVILIEPCRQELFIEVTFAGRSNIARIGGIGHDEHLERRVNVPESPFLEVLLNLIEGFPVGMAAVLQLNLDHRKAINQQGNITAAVPVHLFLPVEFDLMDYFIDRRAASNVGLLEYDRVDRTQFGIFPLDADPDDTVFPHEPLSGIVEGRKTELVLDLLEFTVCQGMFIKYLLIILN